MVEKLVTSSLEEIKKFYEGIKAAWIKDFGNYNKAPEPMEQITEHDYWFKMGTWNPEFIEHRQIVDFSSNTAHCNLLIYWFYDCGIAVKTPRKWRTGKENEFKGVRKPHIVFTEKAQYYHIGCFHDFDRVKIGNCLYRETCKKCSYNEEVDTSG
jgi:hypothetical protein